MDNKSLKVWTCKIVVDADSLPPGFDSPPRRAYGPRWNERTCQVGRDVVLSKGYGKQNRMAGKISRFKKQHGSLFGGGYRAAILDVFGTLDIDIACISIASLVKQ